MADNMEEFKKMKVPELRQTLKDKGLPTSGTKQELISRLSEASSNVDSSDAVIDEDEILKDDVTTTAAPTPKASEEAPKEQPNNVNNNQVELKESEPNVPDSTIAKPTEVKKLTDAERLKMRAEKFGGVTSEQAKKDIRAERFGTALSENKSDNIASSAPPVDLDKLQKRAERFGVSTSSVTEDEKKRKRAERFGTTVSTTTSSDKSISLNSTDSELEAKKRKRAERFGLT